MTEARADEAENDMTPEERIAWLRDRVRAYIHPWALFVFVTVTPTIIYNCSFCMMVLFVLSGDSYIYVCVCVCPIVWLWFGDFSVRRSKYVCACILAFIHHRKHHHRLKLRCLLTDCISATIRASWLKQPTSAIENRS